MNRWILLCLLATTIWVSPSSAQEEPARGDVTLLIDQLTMPRSFPTVSIVGYAHLNRDTTFSIINGTWEVRSASSGGFSGGSFGSFTVSGGEVTATTGVLFESAPNEISFDTTQLAEIEIDFASLTVPANRGVFNFAGSGIARGKPTFWLPAGEYGLFTRGLHLYGALTIGSDLVPASGTGAVVATPTGLDFNHSRLAAVDMDWGDASQPRGHALVGVGEVLSATNGAMLAYLPEGEYRVGTRSYAGTFGTFSVDAGLGVTANAGLTIDADGRMLIDRSGQGEFRMRAFGTPEGFVDTHIAQLSTGLNVDRVFYLPPVASTNTYQIVFSNRAKVAEYGRVTVETDRSISVSAGLLLEAGGTVVPDACAHHVLSFTPAPGANLRYRIRFGTELISDNAAAQGVFPEVTENTLDIFISGAPTTSTLFDITAAGPSQIAFPSAENPLLLIEEQGCIEDGDGDGHDDEIDNCPFTPNAGQEDGDGDSVGDACDLCAGDDATGDLDLDGVCSGSDNCPSDANPAQTDADDDGLGDACEADSDEDGVIDDDDNCPTIANPQQPDADADGEGDACDADDDGDGVDDGLDNCPLIANASQIDTDSDEAGDACDGDDDADGVLDEDDLCPATPMDLVFNDEGCSGAQLVSLTCGEAATFPNHGKYVRCIAQASKEAVGDGLLTSKERAAIVRAAAKSN